MEVDPEDVLQETNFDFDDGLEQVPKDTSHEREPVCNPTGEPTNVPAQEDPAPPSLGMAARNASVKEPLEKYIPTMKGNKYAVAMMHLLNPSKSASMDLLWLRCL